MNNKLYKGSIFAICLSMGLCSNLNAMSDQLTEQNAIQQQDKSHFQIDKLVNTVTDLQAKINELKEEEASITKLIFATLETSLATDIKILYGTTSPQKTVQLLIKNTETIYNQLKELPQQKRKQLLDMYYNIALNVLNTFSVEAEHQEEFRNKFAEITNQI